VILVDTNVLLDVLAPRNAWTDWSTGQLDAAALDGPIAINDVVYAELCVRATTIDEVDEAVEDFGLVLLSIPRLALFNAAKAFAEYRRRGGTKANVLPDFFIGAHAMTVGIPLLTRDSRRYRSYFPGLDLIAPDLAP
jgi:predicted nucleic acid-binding protein